MTSSSYAKYSGLGGGGGGSSYTFADSIVNTGGTVTLVNDSAAPGNSQYYGTNSGGTLGYFSLPTVTAGNLTDAGTDGIIITNGVGAVIGTGTSIAQHVADTSHNGYLSSADWNTFNGKQAAGNYITALTGDGTASGPGSVALTLASVNSNTGSFGSSTSIPSFAVNAKGLITAASGNAVIAPAGTLSGTTLNSTVVTSSLTSLGSQAQALNMGTHQINNVVDPTNAQDAATKNYVDTVASGLQPLQSCYAATTPGGGNIAGTYNNGVSGIGATFTTTATSTFTLDGTTPPLLSRILFKNQTSGFQNGVYTFTTAPVGGVSGAIFTRALDYDTASDMNAGNLIPILNGTVNAPSSIPTIWIQTATITTVGTDNLTFVQFNSGGSGTVTSVTFTGDGTVLSSTPSSAVTTSGTVAATLINAAAAKFLSGPTIGASTTAPTYRSIALGDIPNLMALDLYNVSLSDSVATNALTINLIGTNGSNPSSTNPVLIGFRSATLTTGTYSGVSQTSALSIVIPSSATLGTASAVNQYVWVYAVNDAGTLDLAVCANYIDDSTTQSMTAISSSATSSSVLYSGSSHTGAKAIRLIGRLLVNETTAGTWASAATDIQIKPVPVFASTNWASFTPTFTGTGSNPSVGTGTLTGQWRRMGDSQEIMFAAECGSSGGGNGSGNYLFGIANGNTIDATKIPNTSFGLASCLGVGDVNYAGTGQAIVAIMYNSTTVVYAQGYPNGGIVGTSFPSTNGFATTVSTIGLRYTVPIVGWFNYGP